MVSPGFDSTVVFSVGGTLVNWRLICTEGDQFSPFDSLTPQDRVMFPAVLLLEETLPCTIVAMNISPDDLTGWRINVIFSSSDIIRLTPATGCHM